MRDCFSVLELVFGVVILGLFVFFAMPNKSINTHISLQNATLHTLSHIRYTQHLALNDSLDFANIAQTSTLSKMHPSISPDKLTEPHKNFWQIQAESTRHKVLVCILIRLDFRLQPIEMNNQV